MKFRDSTIAAFCIPSIVGLLWLAVMIFCGVPTWLASWVAGAASAGAAMLFFSINGGNDRP